MIMPSDIALTVLPTGRFTDTRRDEFVLFPLPNCPKLAVPNTLAELSSVCMIVDASSKAIAILPIGN